MIKNTILFFSSIGRTTKPITKKKESTKKGRGPAGNDTRPAFLSF